MRVPEDAFIRELLPEFVDTWINDMKQYQPLLQAKNADDLYRLAHTLKGSCYQFGIDEIAELGIELMGYCKIQDWDKAAEMEPKILNMFIDIKKLIESGAEL
ncbi:MAG: Hpt protein [Bacteroidota bacterium]|nr:Hpt protein [Bacteroidota bacterium]